MFVLLITQLACALHWFNPLVWFAAWRLHIERERACDDLVLSTGVRASSYAEHLLNVATKFRTSQWTQSCGLAMAQNSSLHGRLAAVLNTKQNCRSLTSALLALSIAGSTAVALPFAMISAADEPAGIEANVAVSTDEGAVPKKPLEPWAYRGMDESLLLRWQQRMALV